MTGPQDIPIDPETLDLLVDGELEPERRRELIRKLDAEASGWRRCALAFLEAQALRQELSALAERGTAEDRPAAVARTRRAARWGRGRSAALWLASLAAAAAFSFWVARTLPAPGARQPEPAVATPGQSLPESALPDGPPEGSSALTSVPLRLTADGFTKEEVRVPVLELSPGDPSYGWVRETMLADELLNRLEDAGHEVVERRHFVPVTLADGREAVIPVEEYEVRPVIYRTYQ